MIDEHGLTGMSPAELATAYPDARAVTQRFDDAAFLEVYDGLDHDPALLIRALGQLGEYIRMGDEAERNYLAKLPEGTQVSVPELHANDIDDAIEGLLDRLDPQTRFGVESAARSPEGRQLRDKVGLHAHGCNGGRGGVWGASSCVGAIDSGILPSLVQTGRRAAAGRDTKKPHPKKR